MTRLRVSFGPPADSMFFYEGRYFNGQLKVLTISFWGWSVTFWADFRKVTP